VSEAHHGNSSGVPDGPAVVRAKPNVPKMVGSMPSWTTQRLPSLCRVFEGRFIVWAILLVFQAGLLHVLWFHCIFLGTHNFGQDMFFLSQTVGCFMNGNWDGAELVG
jgi:hypothetical protein